jgi:hypothetical protein
MFKEKIPHCENSVKHINVHPVSKVEQCLMLSSYKFCTFLVIIVVQNLKNSKKVFA